MSIKIQKNISLSKYTSFKIGGPAKYFCAVKNIEEIKEALDYAEKNKLKVLVLGGGSNLLISDEGFDGLVIRIQNSKFKIQNSNIICDSGVSLMKLVNETVKNNLTGLEWAAGIPGTVGGAIVNNAGAFGKCVGDIVESVEACWLHNPKGLWSPSVNGSHLGSTAPLRWRQWSQLKKLNNKQCDFLYRNSIFKKEKRYIILNVVLKLSKGDQKESKEVIAKYLKSRKEKQPLEYPSAGSVFKNPVVDDKDLEHLVKKYPKLKNIAKNNIIPTGWLIEQIEELKNKKIGGAMISEKHCNFIVNFNKAKAEDVVILISLIKQKVRDNFGIQLKEEIEYVGF